ncbi:MAG: AI-2E family transporter [Prochloraceae cyanobacterium]|nr:AI-2E family transporter [Prochloraceae cyanobacterium]
MRSVNFGVSIGFVAVVISLYILWTIRQLLLLLFTAVVLANTLNLLVKLFNRWRINRFLAVPLSVSLLLSVLVGFFWRLAPAFVGQVEDLFKLVPLGIQQLNIWKRWLVARLDPELIESFPDTNELISQLKPIVNQILEEGLSFFLAPLGLFSACYCY